MIREMAGGVFKVVAQGSGWGGLGSHPSWKSASEKALTTPGRPGVRKIAERFGVDPGTVQRISRPFEAGAVGA
jgi:hypothetical protein